MSVQVIERAVAILDAVAAAEGAPCRLREIVLRTGLNRATAYRIVRTLVDQGLLAMGQDKRSYYLGLTFLTLGATASNRSHLRELARPSLLRLAGQFGDSFFLFVPDGYDVVCLDICDGDYPVRSYTRGIGGRVPLGLGQASIAILARMSRAEQDEIISHNLPVLEKEYGIERERLLNELRQVINSGFARGTGSRVLPEYTGLGKAVMDRNNRAVAAISCCVLSSRLSESKREQMKSQLSEEALIIERGANPLDPMIGRASINLASSMLT
ncbi:IclR family transcriptional regulator [Fodinicurvata sediminis]|uniref:IclR family transcriptional regulator n=1 Tax=Fodinicurvata sediminis TaxID=1121832 RepID=UPI0003B45A8E|nr:IclR family transcriptional regulator [Fodinicurvata sediminis]